MEIVKKSPTFGRLSQSFSKLRVNENVKEDASAAENQDYYYDEEESDLLNQTTKRKKAVFCSQFAAKIYEHFEISGFANGSAGSFTPIEFDAAISFSQKNLYIKKENKMFLKADGTTLIAQAVQE
jgi:hypothetical protein